MYRHERISQSMASMDEFLRRPPGRPRIYETEEERTAAKKLSQAMFKENHREELADKECQRRRKKLGPPKYLTERRKAELAQECAAAAAKNAPDMPDE